MEIDFVPVIGIEVHCQLSTRTKIFCACPAQLMPPYQSVTDVPPNLYSCPVCAGHPGTLPVLNRRAVELAVLAGLAFGSTIRSPSVFARKNYFYPDLPKGYQISQYSIPVCEGGAVSFEGASDVCRVSLRRMHLEEDAGKSIHLGSETQINLNRAGVPLIEIVTEPEIYSARNAAECLRALHRVLVAIGVTDGNMQEGNFRCDANVSVRPRGDSKLGTRVEIKNLNSFRFVEKAIQHEIVRQSTLLQSGGLVRQETRLYDVAQDLTEVIRSKEDVDDYRYFPDPDLPPLWVSPEWVHELKSQLPELPEQKRTRYVSQYGLSEYDASVILGSPRYTSLFDLSTGARPDLAQGLCVLISQEVAQFPDVQFRSEDLVEIADHWKAGVISATHAKKLIQLLATEGGTVTAMIQKHGLVQQSDEGALIAWVDQVLDGNPAQVAELRKGKEKVLAYLVGQVMKVSKGKANPGLVSPLIRKRISGESGGEG